MAIERTQSEIEDQIELANQHENSYPGMTYSEGVRTALDWVTGYSDDPPFDPEEE